MLDSALRPVRRLARTVTPLALVAAIGACGSSSSTPFENTAPSFDELPPQLMARSDTPYISGRIESRGPGDAGMVRIRVRGAANPEPFAGRRSVADIVVHPDSLLVRPDGSVAAPADFGVGRAVTVWVRGPELDSSPPQATGSAILLRR